MKLMMALFFWLLTVGTAAADCVVLLHGLARSDRSMLVLERHLTRVGYQVVNISYPSTREPLEQLLDYGLDAAMAQCRGQKIHFVTHSMGGILLRLYLVQHRPETLGHVVMLGPPNQGSELAEKLRNWKLFELINGPAGMALGTGKAGVVHRLASVDFSLGVIAGNRSLNPFYSSLITGADDGKVSVAETRVEGMADHITLPVSHTFMMNSPQAIAQVQLFLQNGRFAHGLSYGEAVQLIWR